MRRTRIAPSATHGRGLFADEDIQAGDIIGEFPLLILSSAETEAIKRTRLYHYIFWVADDPAGGVTSAVAFGAISMCNHSPSANADFKVLVDDTIVRMSAKTNIPCDAEIFIDYEEFATEVV